MKNDSEEKKVKKITFEMDSNLHQVFKEHLKVTGLKQGKVIEILVRDWVISRIELEQTIEENK